MIGIFTHGRHSVMTRCTIVDDTGVIEHRADKRGGVMADTAVLISGDMSGRFTQGERAIVTGLAVVHDTRMIKRSR